MNPTQSRHPWRATLRTALAVVASLAAAAPVIVSAITNDNPEALGAIGAVVLSVAAAVTRVLALPAVNDFLERFLPWLAAAPADEGNATLDVLAQVYETLDDGHPAKAAVGELLGVEGD